MLKALENKNFFILAIVSVCCLLITIVSSQKFQKARKTVNEERYNRMVAEEKIEQLNSKIRSQEASLIKAQAEADRLSALLQNKDGAVADLKLELEKSEQMNIVLQEQLKEALVKKKK